MKQFLPIITLLVCIACEQQQTAVPEKHANDKKEQEKSSDTAEKSTEKASNPATTSSRFRAQYYYSDSLGWGYDIYEGSSMRIHQPHIPAVQGNKGFKSEYDAQKAAEKVIEKLNHGIMPPSLSVEELKELGVL